MTRRGAAAVMAGAALALAPAARAKDYAGPMEAEAVARAFAPEHVPPSLLLVPGTRRAEPPPRRAKRRRGAARFDSYLPSRGGRRR